MAPSGRIVNVASMAGKLGTKYSPTIKDRFYASKTEADVTSIMQDFAAAVEARKEKDAGFPSAAYAVSKAGLIGATRALARVEKEKGGSVLINACCPGYVNTDMSKHNGVLTPDQGAMTPVKLALGDIGGSTGEFWEKERRSEW
jgi:carbonyl reductase 1